MDEGNASRAAAGIERRARATPVRVVVDDTQLAERIGQRLRRARLDAGMTQSALANPRYTKAYVSALENGRAKPSMAALAYLSERLGVPVTRFMDADQGPGPWRSVEVDLALASGRFAEAIDGYSALLEATTDPAGRAYALNGLAEAHLCLFHGPEGLAAAAEAARLFAELRRPAEGASARYWLADGHYILGNSAMAASIFTSLLVDVRTGLRVEPDFEARILMCLAAIEAKDGRHPEALAYLEEVRSLAPLFDTQRRAAYFYDLAYVYRETGDIEAAVRNGTKALALYRAAEFELGVAGLENDLALSYMALGNTARAEELAASSVAHFEAMANVRWLAHVVETQAQIALARGDLPEARARVAASLELAAQTDNHKAAISALRTLARIERTAGDLPAAVAAGEEAVARARSGGSPEQLADALADLADLLAASGNHERAFAVLRETRR